MSILLNPHFTQIVCVIRHKGTISYEQQTTNTIDERFHYRRIARGHFDYRAPRWYLSTSGTKGTRLCKNDAIEK